MPDSGWGALFRNRVSAAHAGIMAQRIQARQPEPWLFQVECSYGGSIVAVCATIRVFDLSICPHLSSPLRRRAADIGDTSNSLQSTQKDRLEWENTRTSGKD
jgi:hypothetical protein